MKALRFTLIAALIACTMVALASTDGGTKVKPKKVVNITFVRAIHTPGLVLAMHQQLHPGIVSNNQLVYTLDVIFQGATYRITGTNAQWRSFFYPKWNKKNEINPKFTVKD